ncbi:MAG: MotE family protein [Nitrospinaceae bacterium]
MMKFKMIFIVLVAPAIILGFCLSGILESGTAYAQVKQIDEQAAKVRGEGKTLPIEEQEKEKIQLPGQVPGVSPETFRMIETIENKNRELKKREEELSIKEVRLEALEAKVRKDLEKIEKSISESKEQMGLQDEKTKENVAALIKVYSSMKPEEAANLVEAIDEDLALKIVSGMKSKIAGQVLSKLDVQVAKRISEKLAGKSKKPAEN